eukprot:CAMPEP_0170629510 /NCGR_PEP_ID=MMETSP0224-20130122/33398_1 /TAXON_ID=285029 /ORGANISM="Togula jolla, Strain CCCM 725" /LENGTH=68 /DNA_ID=CAMNT_0010957291 /DNA_START=491 /DNA_END=698 /DNA_ORIENTATION=-
MTALAQMGEPAKEGIVDQAAVTQHGLLSQGMHMTNVAAKAPSALNGEARELSVQAAELLGVRLNTELR